MTTAAPAITAGVVREHGLTAEEYDKVRSLLGRDPTLTELGIFSVMWSEHCSYKSSRVHLKRLPTKSEPRRAGAGRERRHHRRRRRLGLRLQDRVAQSPSYIEPYQGAATGVGGILRDIFTMGARPLAVMDSLRFGPIHGRAAQAIRNHELRAQEPLHCGRRGQRIAGYGNCFGVPNLGGETKFESCYQRQSAGQCVCAGPGAQRRDFLRQGRRRRAIRSSM